MDITTKQIYCSFEILEKAMNLPKWVKIVSVHENEYGGFRFKIAFSVENFPQEKEYEWPNEVSYEIGDNITNLGDVFANPQNHRVDPMRNKGSTLGETT